MTALMVETKPYWFRLLLVLPLFFAGNALADAYTDSWGPAIGEKVPQLQATDHTGQLRDLESLAADNGLLLFMNRSADW